MTINETILFGQLTLPEPEPTIDAATIKLNRALAGFLAGYSGTTLDAYRLDLRQWVTWLATFHTDPFAVERAHIELYARTASKKARLGRRSGGGCRRSAGSTGTANKNASSIATPPPTSAGPNRTTNRPRSDSIGTNSVRSLSRPDSPADGITRWHRYWR